MKLNKTELRSQQYRLNQLYIYLPTLKLKKFLIQVEINHTVSEIERLVYRQKELANRVEEFSFLLEMPYRESVLSYVEVLHIEKRYENIAGIEIPIFGEVIFRDFFYFLFSSPPWFDAAIQKLRNLVSIREQIRVVEEKKRVLEKELRDVSIRVNLFEKILIPRTERNIKKIQIFLSDQELATVSRAKVAKMKKEMSFA